MTTCPRCRENLIPRATFCHKCGYAIAPTPTIHTTSSHPSSPRPHQPHQQHQPHQHQSHQAHQPSQPPKQSQPSAGLGIVAVLGLGLFTLLGLVTILMMKSNKSSYYSPGFVTSFSTVYSRHDTSCGNVMNHCVKAKCGIRNRGISGGNINVDLMLVAPGKEPKIHSQTVYVPGGDVVEASHDFFEASRFDKNSTMCRIYLTLKRNCNLSIPNWVFG
jgi:hypothetical protein